MPSLGTLHYNDLNYTQILIYYTLFLSFYTIATLYRPTKNAINPVYQQNLILNPTIYTVFNLFSSILFIILFFDFLGLERTEKLAIARQNKAVSFIAGLSMIGLIVVGRAAFDRKHILWHESLFALSAISFGIIEGGREVFIYVLVVLLPEFAKRRNKLLPLIAIGALVFSISLWKAISTYIFVFGDSTGLVEHISANYKFSITALDPIGSLLLLNAFLDGSTLFSDMYGSYVSNTLGQIGNVFGVVEHQSISNRVVSFYSRSVARRGGGFAFSGILESLLNFSHLGPLVTGFFVGWLMRTRNSVVQNPALSQLFGCFLIIISLKLVRTELAVLLKLYLLPMIILLAIFRLKGTR
tara:strand:- start:3399 stop:4463 length:1065 start_codon:yes stop_codon:yes gene_type:complete